MEGLTNCPAPHRSRRNVHRRQGLATCTSANGNAGSLALVLVVFCLYHSSVLFATPMALGWASPFALTIQNSEMLPSALTPAFRCTCSWHPAHSVIKFC